MKALIKGTPWYVHLAMTVAMGLVVAGFCVPPMGVIDGSVLTAVGELLGGTALLTFVINIPAYLDAGVKARFTRGQTTVSVQSSDLPDDEEN